IIIDELKRQQHIPVLYLPEGTDLGTSFNAPTEYLSGGKIVSYDGATKLQKIFLSIKRATRRVKWFDAAYEKAVNGEVDAIVLTTATYRYLKSLHKSKLKNSPVPVIFLFLGVNPHEKPKFVKEAKRCLAYSNIKLKITTLRDDFQGEELSNVELISPPVVIPANIVIEQKLQPATPLRVGFFGHYRKGEKNIDSILKAFEQANFAIPVEFVVQVAPTTEEDKQDAAIFVSRYEKNPNVSFIHGKLAGDAWYDALKSIDVMLLPYSAERYLYNWSALYFTAIGFFKPVLVTPMLNPEVLQKYNIGMEVSLSDINKFTLELESFVNTYESNSKSYEQNLVKANEAYGHKALIEAILK
ncbi:MAG: hypothetical protein ACRC37_05230, partial [Lentisphaeria bacterium]